MPGCQPAMFVSCTVCGTMVRSNSAPCTPFTVRLMPSVVTEPFSAMYFASSFGARTRNSTARAEVSRLTTSPMPSTWPLTMWPPRREVGCRAFSRLTRVPTFSPFSVERVSVSVDTSATKPSPGSSTAVRQTPLVAMESPSLTSVRSSLPVAICRRTSPPRGSMARMVPTASMMPVNIFTLLRRCCRVLLPGGGMNIISVARRSGCRHRPCAGR